MTSLTLADVPNSRANGCDERITLVIPTEAKLYLKSVKACGKDPQELVRMLLADFIKRNPLKPAA
jgi:hypothetical protein